MQTIKRSRMRLIAVLAGLALVAVACGSGDTAETTATTTAATTAATEGTTAATTAATPAPTTTATTEATVEAGPVCPANIVIQSDWFPEPEHGMAYNLIGPDGVQDASNGLYSGPLQAKYAANFENGEVPNIEVRAGGPFLGGQLVTQLMFLYDTITFGFLSNDQGIQFSQNFPTLAVMAPLELNPQILLFDPREYSFTSISEIAASDATVLAFSDQSTWVKFFVGTGAIRQEQIDPSYSGSPARFSTEDGIMSQAFVSNEVYKYNNVFADWKTEPDDEIGFLLMNDSGYEIYSQPMAIIADRQEELDACLRVMVPIFQQAAIDYITTDFGPVNDMLTNYVTDMASFWTLDEGTNSSAVEIMLDLGLVGNGPDSTLGNFDLDRVQRVIDSLLPIFTADGLSSFDPGVTPEDLVTNEYIDASIGLP